MRYKVENVGRSNLTLWEALLRVIHISSTFFVVLFFKESVLTATVSFGAA